MIGWDGLSLEGITTTIISGSHCCTYSQCWMNAINSVVTSMKGGIYFFLNQHQIEFYLLPKPLTPSGCLHLTELQSSVVQEVAWTVVRALQCIRPPVFLTYDQSSFAFERFLTTNLSAEPYWEGSALILSLEESSDELQDTLDNANRNSRTTRTEI